MIEISLFESETSNTPTLRSGDWADVVSLGTMPAIRTTQKTGTPAWSPTKFTPAVRANENARQIGCAVFDLDHLPPEQFTDTIARIDKAPYACVMHSTFSHTPEAPSVRLIFKLSRPVLPAEWPAVWSGVQRMLGLTASADQKVKDPARLYYLPAAKPDAPTLSGTTEGTEAIDVDAILSYAAKQKHEAALEAPAATYAVTPMQGGPIVNGQGEVSLSAIRERIKHIAHPEAKVWAQRVLKGECLEQQGARDNALHIVASAIVFSCPTETPTAAILEVMRPSLALMDPPETGTWFQLAEAKINRARERKVVRDTNSATYAADVRARLGVESSKTAPKSLEPVVDIDAAEMAAEALVGCYSSEQLAQWAAEQKCGSLLEFERRWVIQDNGAYYVFVEGDYARPIGEKVLETSLHRDLARAPIALSKKTKDGGQLQRTATEILRDYSTPARGTQASLSKQRSYYDPATQTFHEAVRPLRRIRAKNHPEIQAWLDLLGGPNAGLLTDWIAAVHRLDRQSAGIYLQGPGGTGKTLLANGLARLWTTGGPTELKTVLGGNFNDALIRCPLVFADESLPKQAGITADVRQFIGSTVRPLTRKYMPSCDLEGAVRVIVAGNNERLLETKEDLSSNDIEAFAGRFLYITAPIAAAEYLKSLGGPSVVGQWITGDMLAEHATYLRSVRTVDEKGRFLVGGVGTEFRDRLATSSGVSPQVCEFLVHYLTDPMTLARPSPLVLTGEGELLVCTDALAKDTAWDGRVPSVKVPPAAAISRALSGISNGSLKATVGTEARVYFRVRADLMLNHAEGLQLGNTEAVKARIAAPNADIAAALKA